MNAKVKIKGFTIIRVDRWNLVKEGTAIFLHNIFLNDAKGTFSNSYCESESLFNRASDITIVDLYRPPQSTFKEL